MPEEDRDNWAAYVQERVKIIMGGLDGYNKRNEINPLENGCVEMHTNALDDVLKRFWADMPEAERDGVAEYVHRQVKHIMGE